MDILQCPFSYELIKPNQVYSLPCVPPPLTRASVATIIERNHHQIEAQASPRMPLISNGCPCIIIIFCPSLDNLTITAEYPHTPIIKSF